MKRKILGLGLALCASVPLAAITGPTPSKDVLKGQIQMQINTLKATTSQNAAQTQKVLKDNASKIEQKIGYLDRMPSSILMIEQDSVMNRLNDVWAWWRKVNKDKTPEAEKQRYLQQALDGIPGIRMYLKKYLTDRVLNSQSLAGDYDRQFKSEFEAGLNMLELTIKNKASLKAGEDIILYLKQIVSDLRQKYDRIASAEGMLMEHETKVRALTLASQEATIAHLKQLWVALFNEPFPAK